MKVRLISYTQPDNIIGVDDAQELIAYCARVSNPGNQNNKETSEKLVKYLIKNRHWSPLEMVNACIEIETTRDIARQILRHRSFSFQEFSQRYADPTKDLSFETRDARLQDPKNRQNSIELSEEDRRLNEDFRMRQMSLWTSTRRHTSGQLERYCQGTGPCSSTRGYDCISTVHEWYTALMGTLH